MNRSEKMLMETTLCLDTGEPIARINSKGQIELKMYKFQQDDFVWIPIWKGREIIIRDFLTRWFEEEKL